MQQRRFVAKCKNSLAQSSHTIGFHAGPVRTLKCSTNHIFFYLESGF